MKTTVTCPDFPDDPKNEKGPARRANDEGAQSENAQKERSDNAAKSQEAPDQPELFSYDPKSKNLPNGSVGDLDGSIDSIVAANLKPKGILALRLPASELEGVETKRVRTKITVDKPPRDQFFMVKDGADYWVPFGLIELERSSSFYLVAPGLVRDWLRENDIKSYYDCVLCLVVTWHGEPRVWPLKQTTNSWHESAREIAEMAKTGWTKLISDQAASCYVAGTAANQVKKPAWPAESFEEILEKAFAGRIIDSLDHDVIKELRGDE